MAKKWKKIEDQNVRLVWTCQDPDCLCQGERVDVNPSFFQDNGEPQCSCGQDMNYLYTEVCQ